MPTFPFFRINAFLDPAAPLQISSGNPAAVVLLTAEESDGLNDATRQSLAHELKLSETAFVTSTQAANSFHICWFTPEAEVALCGHATLAAGQALLSSGWASAGSVITFKTRTAGDLSVITREGEIGDQPPLEMQFPLLSTRTAFKPEHIAQLRAALRVDASEVEDMFQTEFDTVVIARGEQVVRGMKPDMGLLRHVKTRGVIVCAKSSGDALFVSRFFAPRVGIDEDPVTGSAHSVLAAVFLTNGETCNARQLSKRGGLLRVKRGTKDRVFIGGWTKVVVNGEVSI